MIPLISMCSSVCCEPPVDTQLCENNTSSVKTGINTPVAGNSYHDTNANDHVSHIFTAVMNHELKNVDTGL